MARIERMKIKNGKNEHFLFSCIFSVINYLRVARDRHPRIKLARWSERLKNAGLTDGNETSHRYLACCVHVWLDSHASFEWIGFDFSQ